MEYTLKHCKVTQYYDQECTYKKMNLLLTNSISSVFSFLKNLRSLAQTKGHYIFLLCLKRNDSKTFESSNLKKKKFSNVHVTATTCFDKCFLFHVIHERHSFLLNFIVTLRVLAFFATYDLKEVRILLFYLQNNSLMLIAVPK